MYFTYFVLQYLLHHVKLTPVPIVNVELAKWDWCLFYLGFK